MSKPLSKTENMPTNVSERPPIVVVMGHIDHGKSTLLDNIRKSNVVGTEAGGITQHISAYEVTHKVASGTEKRITFLDTPGHEAFQKMRFRGAEIADIAILVVSAEDGVKAQTLEALASIEKSGIPFIVALNKIDKPNANVERTKQTLTENKIYLEGLGGQVPWVLISAKQGTGIPELLDLALLVAELEELTGTSEKAAEGVVIESSLDPKQGVSATLIIRDGTLTKDMFLSSGGVVASVRIMEDFMGKPVTTASFSSPVRIVGWSGIPQAGAAFASFGNKKEAERVATQTSAIPIQRLAPLLREEGSTKVIVPIILKADTLGSLDALEHELEKLENERLLLRVIQKNAGSISENDVKVASGVEGTLVLGFNTKIDNAARDLALRTGVEVQTFDIIYKLSEWLAETALRRTPKVEMEEITGKVKVLKSFSRVKDKQVVGGRVEAGVLKLKASVRIMRRDIEVGRGNIVSLQQGKSPTPKVETGNEFGTQVQSKIELMPGDYLEVVTKTMT